LLYQSDRTGDEEIWLMQADGTGKHNLTQAPRADDKLPAWSPDGTKIAFTSDRGTAHNDEEIVVMNNDGSNQTSISGSPADDYEPAWSPDGRRIAFGANRNSSYPDLRDERGRQRRATGSQHRRPGDRAQMVVGRKEHLFHELLEDGHAKRLRDFRGARALIGGDAA
jgi:dipeptidyl aminopeptidase/acylaminoacyl peptidase